MKIPRRLIVNPDDNVFFAVPAVAISTLMLGYSHNLGPASVLLFFALWLPLPLIGPARAGRAAGAALVVLALPLFACLSAVWSDAPAFTLRAAMQYFSLLLCTVIAAIYISVPSLIWGLLIGCHVINIWSLAFGHEVFDYFGNSYAFAGLFPSKNVFGFFTSIGILSSFSAIAMLNRRYVLRAAIGVASLQFFYALIISDSATSLISLVGAMLVLCTALILGRLPRTLRRVAIFAVVLALPLFAVLLLADFTDILNLTGRDTTLTGRTDLWAAGLSVFSGSPMIGVGYQAFWRPGVPLAEQLWHDFYITNPVGFHFHNTYVGILADLGLVGLVLFLLPVGGALFDSVREALHSGDNRIGAIRLAFMTLLLIRSMVEIDVFAAYTIGPFLIFYLSFFPWRRAIESRYALLAQYRAATGNFGWAPRN